jgi:hypothetical protein
MVFTYEIIEEFKVVKRSDGAFIPMDEANSDYQAYLKRNEPQVEHLTEIVPADE